MLIYIYIYTITSHNTAYDVIPHHHITASDWLSDLPILFFAGETARRHGFWGIRVKAELMRGANISQYERNPADMLPQAILVQKSN